MNLRSKELAIKGATKRASSMRKIQQQSPVTMPRRSLRLAEVLGGGYEPPNMRYGERLFQFD